MYIRHKDHNYSLYSNSEIKSQAPTENFSASSCLTCNQKKEKADAKCSQLTPQLHNLQLQCPSGEYAEPEEVKYWRYVT